MTSHQEKVVIPEEILIRPRFMDTNTKLLPTAKFSIMLWILFFSDGKICQSGSWETGIWPGEQWAVQCRLWPDHLDSLTKQATFSPSKCIPLKELSVLWDLPGAPVALPVSNPAKEGMHSRQGEPASADLAFALGLKQLGKGIGLSRIKRSWLRVLPAKDWWKNSLAMHSKGNYILKRPCEIR